MSETIDRAPDCLDSVFRPNDCMSDSEIPESYPWDNGMFEAPKPRSQRGVEVITKDDGTPLVFTDGELETIGLEQLKELGGTLVGNYDEGGIRLWHLERQEYERS